MSSSEAADVIVVGAGIAGLNAALILQDSGARVIVLEASHRVGGRIYSRESGGVMVDFGATGYGPTHRRSKALLARFALKTKPELILAPFVYSVNGVLVREEDWAQSPANLTVGEEREILPSRIDNYYMQEYLPFSDLAAWKDPKYREYDISFLDFLRSKGRSQEALRLINMCINTKDIATTSALTLFRDALKWRETGYTDPKNFNQYGDLQYQPVRCAGGNSELPEAVAAVLDVRLNKKAVRVEQADGRVTVTCADGVAYRAPRIVMAAPLMTLSNIVFEPALPPDQTAMIAEGSVSDNTQFILKAKKPFWVEDGLPPSTWTDTVFERMFVSPAPTNDGSIELIRVWINGINATAIDKLPRETAEAKLLDTLAALRPATRGNLEVIDHISWGLDPLIRGEKFVLGAGQVTRFANIMARPFQGIHWAGEHHKSLEVGIEAAVESGERAANEIMELT
jgi:monoamine oxidase